MVLSNLKTTGRVKIIGLRILGIQVEYLELERNILECGECIHCEKDKKTNPQFLKNQKPKLKLETLI